MTDEEINTKDAEIKAKFNYIKKAVQTDEDGVEHVAYFRKPNRVIVGIFLAEMEKNVVTACEYIFDDTVIKEVSDVDYFRNDDKAFLGILYMLQGLVQVKKSIFTT